jgi:hypothetical protein
MSSGNSGGGGTTTTVQNKDPWSEQQPYLKTAMGKAQTLYDAGNLAPAYYPDSTVVPRDALTTQAQDIQAQRAVSGSPLMTGANQQITDTMGGQYLGGSPGTGALTQMAQGGANPYLDQMFGQAAGKSGALLDAKFSMGGRYGSGAHENAYGDQMTSLANQMYGSAYEGDQARRLAAAGQLGTEYSAGRAQQLTAAGMAPTLANQAYTDAAKLAEVGTARENYQQQLTDADISRYNYDQNREANALAKFQGLISGNYGGTDTSSVTAPRANPLASGLSGATAGGGLGYMIGGGQGAGIGAGLGGLLGLFG